jgi:hypothetical protein
LADKRYYWLKLQDGFFDSKRIKKLRKLAGGDTYTIIYLKHYWSPLFIQNKVVIFIDGISQWNSAAIVFTLRRSLEHPTGYLFGKLSAKPLADSLKHTLCDDAGAICGNVLFGRYNSYSVVGKYLLVVTGIILVASKAIQLVDQNSLESMAFAVFDHSLKIRTAKVCTTPTVIHIKPCQSHIRLLRNIGF